MSLHDIHHIHYNIYIYDYILILLYYIYISLDAFRGARVVKASVAGGHDHHLDVHLLSEEVEEVLERGVAQVALDLGHMRWSLESHQRGLR